MKTNVYTTMMLGVALTACLSACSTKSDVNETEMAVSTVDRDNAEGNVKGLDYEDFIRRDLDEAKVFDGEDTITLLTNNVEAEDTLVVL